MIDLRRLLRLDEPRLLAQQVRLVIDNIRGTTWVGLLMVVLVRLALAPAASASALNLWCLVQFAIAANIHRMVVQHDRWTPMTDAQARRMTGELLIGTVVGAMNWGVLLWAMRPDADAAQLAVVYALVAAVQSGAVSTLGSLLPLSIAFLLSSSAAVLFGVGLRGLAEHPAVAFGGALFAATLLDQAIRGARAARTSIQLRFENADLLERVRAEHDAAERAQRQAEDASAAKSQVLAAASHDLRQPVHAQGLFLELLGATELTERQRSLLARAGEAVDASAAMLGTLFDYSRIEAGVIRPQREAFAIQPMLNMIEREFGPQADARGLTYRSRESALVLASDPALVGLILRNLVSNAIRYTRRGGLLVTCRQRGPEAWLEVWDTGIGIAPEHQAEVFREFHQLDNPERDRHKGFGLGLAIVDGLARTLGHTLSLRSVPRRGSVFGVRLPIASCVQPASVRIEHTAPRVLDAHVLVIDDDETILMGMAELLQSWGCSCDVAPTIAQGLALATQRPPDLLVTDYRLREQRTGLQAIEALHAALGRPAPTVLITGDTAPDRLREAAAHGITLLHKPVSPPLLYRALAEALPAR